MGVTLRYTRDQLIALRDVRASTSDVTAGAHPVHRRRGCRAGRLVKSKQTRRASCVLGDSGDGRIPVIVGNRPVRPVPHRNRHFHERSTDDTHRRLSVRVGASVDTSATPADVEPVTPTVASCRPSYARRVRLQRHSSSSALRLVFGSMNVQSANNKIDDIIAMKRDQQLDVMCLCETWHDPDSVSIRRLRAEGLHVLECARPRTKAKQTSLAPAHGGVALVATAGVRLAAVNTGGKKTTLEHICARVTSRGSSCVVLFINLPAWRMRR